MATTFPQHPDQPEQPDRPGPATQPATSTPVDGGAGDAAIQMPAAAVYVPNERTVAAVAASLYAQIAPRGSTTQPGWEQLPKIARLPYLQTALTALTAAGEQLVGSVLGHVIEHHQQYGFNTGLRDELAFAQQATYLHAELAEMLTDAATHHPDTPDAQA